MSKQIWTLTEHITAHLSKPRMGDARPPTLWPSEGSCVLENEHGEDYVVGACRRATFFRYTVAKQYYDNDTRYTDLVQDLLSVQEQPSKYTRWIWEAGNLFEDYIVEMSKQSGVWLASQVQVVVPEYNIVGKLDLLVTDPYNKDVIAQEVKSIYGYNANSILGSNSERNRHELGEPRHSNLMQISVYDWHLKKRMPDMRSRLLYGARDTGRYAEFEVTTYEEDNIIKIAYQGVSPFLTSIVISPITVTGILDGYQYILDHYEQGTIPPRDFDWQYSDEKLKTMYERNELCKTDREAYEKIVARKQENLEREAEGKPPKKELKGIEKGDYQCEYCPWKHYCFSEDKTPRK